MRCALTTEGKKIYADSQDRQGEIVAEYPGSFRVTWDSGLTETVDASFIEVLQS